MILVIDNYDSFTFNLVDQLRRLGSPLNLSVETYRNDEITVSDAIKAAKTGLVISPGPGGPQDSGISLELLSRIPNHLPVLGVCLGHQVLAEFYGASVVRAFKPIHGESEFITHSGQGLFFDLSQPIEVARYHSLVVAPHSLPLSPLRVHATSSIGEIMAIEHTSLPRWGVQFHPESFLTKHGDHLINNFLKRCLAR